jgi:single-strand DNA-binding protein
MAINRVVLVGRLTKDPVLKYTPNGVAVATFTLAVNRNFTNQDGDREADFINCVVWKRPAENVANFLRKGSLAGVDGRIQTRNFEGQDRRRIFMTEVVSENVQFLDPQSNCTGEENNQGNRRQNNSNQHPANRAGNGHSGQNSGWPGNQNEPIDIADDDLPF